MLFPLIRPRIYPIREGRMMRQTIRRFGPFILGVLVLVLVVLYTGEAQARRGRHHHRHHHHRHHFFFGLHYYGYPDGFPYYGYPYYAEPYAGPSYYPEEHRRFPAFRLPAFFHYPGALGKNEGATHSGVPQTGDKSPSDANRSIRQEEAVR